MTKNASIITITPTNNTSANNQELVLYRDSDLPFPDPKDDDEYEESFQRSRRIRILVIMAAALLVVGAAIAITFAAIPTSDASQSSGLASTTVAPITVTTTTAPVVPAELLVGGTLPDEVVTVETPTSTPDATPQVTTATPEPTTVTPEPTTNQDMHWRSTDLVDHSRNLGPYESLDLNALDYGPGKNIMIRATANNDATLFEGYFDPSFNVVPGAGGTIWYDISVIPNDCGTSWSHCSGSGVGYNAPLTVEVVGKLQAKCENLVCNQPRCPAGYHVPDDNLKVKSCEKKTSFILTFGCATR
ncbi:hypothetical protein DYB30_014276 [Aphanomyces astaci]|uniref:Uncharacterized protein n=1 Tax=Aphanomyces astaci TaxID=112090 RepID=A0A397EEK9_APHAT|nr:hypothetical protein DYB30_014276 [Aphanomyces astaci]